MCFWLLQVWGRARGCELEASPKSWELKGRKCKWTFFFFFFLNLIAFKLVFVIFWV